VPEVTVRYSTVWYGTVQYGRFKRNSCTSRVLTVQCGTRYSKYSKHGTVQFSTVGLKGTVPGRVLTVPVQ
jgi:hypothetical protein